jgi:RNA polymerase sigma factor (TIGR02999 family)
MRNRRKKQLRSGDFLTKSGGICVINNGRTYPPEVVPTTLNVTLDHKDGSSESLDEVVLLVYEELRRLAAHYLRGERADHTLQPTALVNEAYLCLAKQDDVRWQNRAHFLAIAANTMRRVLVDHARERGAVKRGGDRRRVTLRSSIALDDRDVDILSLDEALQKLAGFDPEGARVVELRFFGGLTVEETAEATGTSPATVKRTWTAAKAWLYRELSAGDRA